MVPLLDVLQRSQDPTADQREVKMPGRAATMPRGTIPHMPGYPGFIRCCARLPPDLPAAHSLPGMGLAHPCDAMAAKLVAIFEASVY